MDLVLCHTTADFDTLGAAVGAALLRPGSRIVLAGDAHPTVQSFLAVWRDEYPFIERRSVAFDQVRSLTLVDAGRRDRFAPVNKWLQQAEQAALPIYVYDHHVSDTAADSEDFLAEHDFPTAEIHIAPVGAVTTLIVEALQQRAIVPTPSEATVMALGIHSDTGSLTFDQATSRDAQALAWLMAQGANQQVIAENRTPELSPRLQDLLSVALATIQTETVRGHQLGWVVLDTQRFVPGCSGLAEQLMTLLGLDTLVLCAHYFPHSQAHFHADSQIDYQTEQRAVKALMIGRSRVNSLLPHSHVDLRPIFESLGGGGHAQAASAVLKAEALAKGLAAAVARVLDAVRSQIPPLLTAKSLMSSPVRTILPTTPIEEAQRILLRYGHSGLCVVNEQADLVGIISRRDIDITLRHGLGHAPVKGCMSKQIKSITPQTPITEIQTLMITHNVGRLPVLQAGKLIGIVTRTDLLRQLHRPEGTQVNPPEARGPVLVPHSPRAEALYQQLETRISDIWPVLMLIVAVADQKGWSLYLVGGAVRDLLLSQLPQRQFHPLTDIDLVVDGAGEGAGVALAEAVQARYPQVTVQIHGQFQTAALVWHSTQSGADDSDSDRPSKPLLIDIATARTEFYPYPAANPEVEASTIRQDLYRRDFSINAMAIRLNSRREDELGLVQPGQLLDYFGGWLDLHRGYVRVLHANSLIEDPTRIFRAVRFAVRLGFVIEPQTEQYIRYAISSGVYAQTQAINGKTPALQTRLKAELTYLLSANEWAASLRQLSGLGALACIDSALEMTPSLWRQLRRMDRWLNKFDNKYLGKAQPCWLMLLQLIIAQLEPSSRDRVAINLDLGAQSQRLLKNLHLWEADLLKRLPQAQRPSDRYSLLQAYSCCELLVMGDRHPYTLGPQIWQHIVRPSHQPPLLTGETLKQLGYKPGPLFRDILNAVNMLALDGELTTPQAAEAYVLSHYPAL
jgi:tRNA nucleotidyltransferase (CCA-adding enzyme)